MKTLPARRLLYVQTPPLQQHASWRDFYELGKPRVVLLIMFTAVVGMFLAAPGWPPLNALIFGSLGIALAASSAAAINHVLDRRFDAQMARTRNRPLPTGHVNERQALGYAAGLAIASMLLLALWVNVLTAVLTFCSLIGYAVVYTVWLKHATPQNIVIGGAAGAAPPVLGWTAVTGSVDPYSLLLFLIIFTHILLYTILLVIVTLLPYLTGMSGLIYLLFALVLGGVFLHRALMLKMRTDARLPMRTFAISIKYLALLFAGLLVDHYFRIRLEAGSWGL
jgi:protoheme IX farnesyltransferase